MIQQHAGSSGQALPSSGGYRLGGGTGESHAPPAHPGASAASPPSASSAPAPRPAGSSSSSSSSGGGGGRKPANPAAVAQLQDMGPWSRELIEKALVETGNSVENALDWFVFILLLL